MQVSESLRPRQRTSPRAESRPRTGACTEAAALHAARWMGRGDKEAADQAAVDAMRDALRFVDMDGIVVIGEGEKDEAPMLYIGERVGTGRPPKVDVAVDPIDGTNLTAKGLPNAIQSWPSPSAAPCITTPTSCTCRRSPWGPLPGARSTSTLPSKITWCESPVSWNATWRISPWSCSIDPAMRDSLARFARPALDQVDHRRRCGRRRHGCAAGRHRSGCPDGDRWHTGGRARHLRAQVSARRDAVQIVAAFGRGETEGARRREYGTSTGS